MRLCMILESGTDVRFVEGLAANFDLTVLARRVAGGVEISQPPDPPVSIAVGPPSRLRFAWMVWRHLRDARGRIDVVLVQGYHLSALAANLAAHVTGTPTIMHVVSPVEAYYACRRSHPQPDKPFRWWELMLLGLLARLNARIGQRYLVVSEYLAGVVRAFGTRAPIHVVPVYGVDMAVFTPSAIPRARLREELGVPPHGSLIFFGSRIAPEKDSDTLLTAVRLLLGRGRDVWLLHRSGSHHEFARAAARFGVASRVMAADAVHPLTELPRSYQACDVCVQASREEGLGFSVLEALACGVPVVAAAVGGLRETIVDGRTGWSYPAGDAAALAASIESVLDDPAEAERRTIAGRDMVARRFERTRVFEALVAVCATARA